MWKFLGNVFLVMVSHERKLHQLNTSLGVLQKPKMGLRKCLKDAVCLSCKINTKVRNVCQIYSHCIPGKSSEFWLEWALLDLMHSPLTHRSVNQEHHHWSKVQAFADSGWCLHPMLSLLGGSLPTQTMILCFCDTVSVPQQKLFVYSFDEFLWV